MSDQQPAARRGLFGNRPGARAAAQTEAGTSDPSRTAPDSTDTRAASAGATRAPSSMMGANADPSDGPESGADPAGQSQAVAPAQGRPVAAETSAPAPQEARRPTTREERTEVVETTGGSMLARSVAVVVAILLGLLGAVTLVKTGVHGDMSSPTVKVAGFQQTPLMGVVELAGALLALLAAVLPGVGMTLFAGVVFVVAGLLAILVHSSLPAGLPVDRVLAWLLVAAGAVMVVTGLLGHRRRVVRRTIGSYE
jgi:hypothetical protein